jgi:2-polyprenyl-3-methyl-5-hydroxy-6-metoxy-1,4-benzoquinol methylase
MSSYLDHLQNAYSEKTFQRKLQYIDHNIGRFFEPKKFSGMSVLEIGPGLGELVAYCNKRKNNSVDVIDNDEGILKYISNHFKVRSTFLSSDISTLDKKLEKYNLIVMIQILEHMPPDQYQSVMRTLYKHLHPGGEMIIVVPNGNNPLGMVERYGDLQHYNSFTTRSLQDLAALANIPLSEVVVRGYEIPPSSIINILRIMVQKVTHLFLLAILIGNGGTFFWTLTPNIMLQIKKSSL